MAWTLKDLIKASGYSGVAGQSFRSNVLGAATGAKVSDYKQTAASWDTQTFSGLHNPNDSYVCTLTFTEGSRAFNFRNGGNVIVLSLNDTQVVKSSESMGSAGSGTATVTVDGKLDIGGAGVSSTFTVPTSPIAFGSGGGANTVHFIVSVNSTASGSDFLGWHFTIPTANIGNPFNTYDGGSGVSSGSYSVEVRRRAPSITDYDFEWYSDSTFTTFYDSGSNVLWTQPSVGADKTLWVRWRVKPALNGGVTTWTQRSTGCVFTDNR